MTAAAAAAVLVFSTGDTQTVHYVQKDTGASVEGSCCCQFALWEGKSHSGAQQQQQQQQQQQPSQKMLDAQGGPGRTGKLQAAKSPQPAVAC
jgi:hypothetical protein